MWGESHALQHLDPNRMRPRRAPPGWFLADKETKSRAVPSAPGVGQTRRPRMRIAQEG
jgi:hypothetical protein